ncbi:MAG: hypothetical protein R2939_15735 [Kofleriaceae bacterium]
MTPSHRPTAAKTLLLAGLLAAGASPAWAQPDDGAADELPAAAPAPVDEAAIRELVDREVARILAERAAVAAAEAPAPVAPAPTVKAAVDLDGSDDGDYAKGGSGFLDGRLNFTLTNENVFAEPGETVPSVPGWRFGRPNSLGTLFFDNYDTRFSGFENLSHAAMYRNYRKGHVEVEAGIVTRINSLAERDISLSDAGSYILTAWWKDPEHKDPTRFTVTAFPVSSDRFRLGYSYRLSWGGNEEYRRSKSAVPGIKFQYDTEKAYAFAGLKSSVLLDPATAEQVGVFAALGGAGYDLTDMVRVEANGGVFNRGGNELEDVNSENVVLYGGSAQVAVHKGMPVSSSVDYKLYKYDPERIGRVYEKPTYKDELSWLAMAEATLLGQTLKDPEATGTTKVQWGLAGDINLRVAKGRLRVRADAQYRDLAFVLHSVPSLPTYSDFPKEYDIKPNFFADAGADYNLGNGLTLGATLGVELPATLTSPSGVPGDTTTSPSGESTAVIRYNNTGSQSQAIINVLPPGETAAAQVALKTTATWDISDAVATIVDIYYSYDPNQTRLRRDGPEDLFEYEFGEFNQLGFNLTLQAKF